MTTPLDQWFLNEGHENVPKCCRMFQEKLTATHRYNTFTSVLNIIYLVNVEQQNTTISIKCVNL